MPGRSRSRAETSAAARSSEGAPGRALALCALAWVCLACADNGAHPRPPAPPVLGVEPLLAARLLEGTRTVHERPESGEAWGRLAEIYDVNSLEDPALTCYARAETLETGSWRWPYFAGLMLRSRDPAAALARFERAAQLEPEYAPLRFHLGLAHYLAENLDEAERHLERALELDPNCTNAALGLARIAVARGEAGAALSILERIRTTASDEGAFHIHLAQVFRELGRHADAEREEGLTARSPGAALPDGMAWLDDPVREEVKRRECVSARRWLDEARQELLAGRKERAAAMLERALAADPRSVAALVASARLLVEERRLEPATEHLERAVALDAGNTAARVELAAVYVLSGRLAEAVEALEQALAIDPDLPGGKLKLAGLLLQTGRGVRALELLRQAVRERPDDAVVQERLSTVLAGLDRFEEAVSVLGDLAASRAERGEFGEAARTARAALDLAARGAGGASASPEQRERLGQLARELRERIAHYDTQGAARTREPA